MEDSLAGIGAGVTVLGLSLLVHSRRLSRRDNRLIPIRCNHATNHIQQGSHPSFPLKRESIRPPSVNTAASHRNRISLPKLARRGIVIA